MAERNTDTQKSLNITYEQLQDLMRTMIGELNRPNPIEARALQAELEKERRRNILAVELGYASEMQRYNQQHSCTHHRDEKSGQSVAKGNGTPTTSGQVLGSGNILLICLRCSTEWIWQPTREELEYVNNASLLGFPPPSIERCLNRDQFITKPPVKPEVSYEPARV